MCQVPEFMLVYGKKENMDPVVQELREGKEKRCKRTVGGSHLHQLLSSSLLAGLHFCLE